MAAAALLLLLGGSLCHADGSLHEAPPSQCRFNLTAASECSSSHCVLPPTTRPQGSSWVEGDFSGAAFSGAHASLLLVSNSSRLPALSVVVSRVVAGVAARVVAAKGALAEDSAGHGQMALNLTVDILSWPIGEYTVAVAPDRASITRGWCGELRRFLRKVAAIQPTAKPAIARLRIDQPMLFLDEFYIAERSRGTARTLVPAIQQRIANDTFCSTKPHPWMKLDRPPKQACASCPVALGLAVNYGKASSPLDDPDSEKYDCVGALNVTARDGSRVWTCWSRRAGPVITGVAQAVRPADRSASESSQLQRSAWPPPPLVRWPIASTHVRHYDATADGPVDLTQISVYFTYGSDSGHAPTVINNVSLPALSGSPIWQRLHGGVKQTLILPVDGVAGRPLLHCGTPPSQLQDPNVTCRDPEYCQCAGPNITDRACSNDNFGGSWLLPPSRQTDNNHSAAAAHRPLTFVYAQARRISAFAPHSVPYDNLAQVRKQYN